MPKKTVRNAFYLFMMDFREVQKQKGIVYENMAKLSEAAGPGWASAPPNIRKKYEGKAKAEKEKMGGSANKYTSTGISYAALEAKEREQREAENAEIHDIKNFVKLKHFDNSLQHKDIFLMDVNSFCKYNSGYLFGEATILRFSLEDGIKDCYHVLINPGFIPSGFAFDVKTARDELGLEMPDGSSDVSNLIQILANIIDFMKQQDPKCPTLPAIFTMPSKVVQVQDFINQMCRKAAEDESIFRVYRLDKLFYTLINTIKNKEEEGLPTEAIALMQLEKDAFKYTPGLGCRHHEANELSIECTTSRVKRWAYTVLDKTIAIFGDYIPGKHLPADFDIEGFINYKDQKKEMPGPSVNYRGRNQGYISDTSSCNSSMVGASVATSVTSSTTASAQRPRWGPNLANRKPFTPNGEEDYTHEDFPVLGSRRGGLMKKFGAMNMND